MHLQKEEKSHAEGGTGAQSGAEGQGEARGRVRARVVEVCEAEKDKDDIEIDLNELETQSEKDGDGEKDVSVIHVSLHKPTERINYQEPLIGPKEKDLRTVTFDDPRLPDWLRDNPFLQHGHRLQTKSLRECIDSLWYWNNESANIWTHLGGAILIFSLGLAGIIQLAIWQSTGTLHTARITDLLLILPTFFGAVLCLSFSALMHTFYCKSPQTCATMCRFDYAGIVVLISGSIVSITYFGLRCDGDIRAGFLGFSSAVAVLCIYLLVIRTDLLGPRWTKLRVFMFTLLGFSGLVPLTISAIRHPWTYVDCAWMLTRYSIPSALLQILGGLLYAYRVPERYYPGAFDYVGHSHSLLHCCVVIAVFIQGVGLWESWMLWNGPKGEGWELLGGRECT